MTTPKDIIETARRLELEYHNQTPGRRERSLAEIIAEALWAERDRRSASQSETSED